MISSSFVMIYNNPQVEFHRNVLQFWWIIIFFKCFRMQVGLEKKRKEKKRKEKKRTYATRRNRNREVWSNWRIKHVCWIKHIHVNMNINIYVSEIVIFMLIVLLQNIKTNKWELLTK